MSFTMKKADVSPETSSNLRHSTMRNVPDGCLLKINYIALFILLDAFRKGNRLKNVMKIDGDVVNLSATVSVRFL